MFKLCVFIAFFIATVSAGYLGAPLGYPALAHAPLAPAIHAPIAYPAPIVKAVAPVAPVYHAPALYHAPAVVKAVAPVATSYANTYKVSLKAPVAVAHAAPAIVAAPAYHSPIAYGHPYGYAHSYYH